MEIQAYKKIFFSNQNPFTIFFIACIFLFCLKKTYVLYQDESRINYKKCYTISHSWPNTLWFVVNNTSTITKYMMKIKEELISNINEEWTIRRIVNRKKTAEYLWERSGQISGGRRCGHRPLPNGEDKP